MQDQPSSRIKYDISKFQNPDIAITFEDKIRQELISNKVNDQSVDRKWRTIRYIVIETSNTVISFINTKN